MKNLHLGAIVALTGAAIALSLPRRVTADVDCCEIKHIRWEHFERTQTGPHGAVCNWNDGHGQWWVFSGTSVDAYLDTDDPDIKVYDTLEGTDGLKVVTVCPNWHYSWWATGAIGGDLLANADAAAFASAAATASASAQMSVNLDKFDSQQVAAADSTGVQLYVGAGLEGPNGGVFWTPRSITGALKHDGKHLSGTDTKQGAGREVQVGIDLRGEAMSVADAPLNLGWAPHNLKAASDSRVFPNIVLGMAIYCAGPGIFMCTWDNTMIGGDLPKRRRGPVTPGGGIGFGPPTTPPVDNPPTRPPAPGSVQDLNGDGWTD